MGANRTDTENYRFFREFLKVMLLLTIFVNNFLIVNTRL